MASDEIVWQVINQQFCSYKIKTTKNQTFCRNEYNVSGLCSRQACPLANSQYASVRADAATGALYLYTKTIERAHAPARWWERVRLPRDYASALATIDSRLQYWPFWQVHKCKQRLTRLTQVALRTRRLAKEQERLGETLVPRMAPKVRRREEGRERKALAAAKVERAIERELVERLRSGAYGDRPLNAEEGVWKKVLRALERSGEGERDEDLDEGIENEEEDEGREKEMEMEREWEIESDVEVNGVKDDDVVGDVEYVSDVDESDEDDDPEKGQDIEDLGELEDWLGGQSEEDDVDDYDDDDLDDDLDEEQSISSNLDFESEDDDDAGDDDHDGPDEKIDSQSNIKSPTRKPPTASAAAVAGKTIAAATSKTITSPLKRKRSDIPSLQAHGTATSKPMSQAPKSTSSAANSTATAPTTTGAAVAASKKNDKSRPKSTGTGIGTSTGTGVTATARSTSTSTAADMSRSTSAKTERKNPSKRITSGPVRKIEYEYEYEHEIKDVGKGKGDGNITRPLTKSKMKA